MPLPFRTDDGAASRAALGLIVLATDETLEPELAMAMPGAGAALYHSRIPAAPTVTPETLARMEADLPTAAALLPDRPFDVIAYGCTSASSIIGSERVAELVSAARPTRAVTDPLAAVIQACGALGARRVGFLTPYAPAVSAAMRARLEAAGVEIAAFASFEEERESVVARIAEEATLEAVKAVGAEPGVEIVFASCTNLRTFGIIDAAEAALGIPVISSNLALAWDLLRRALLKPREGAPGRLLATL